MNRAITGRDLLYVGGVPDLYRSDGDLESDGRLVGAVYAVEVDGRNVGVWNFVDASDGGCKGPNSIEKIIVVIFALTNTMRLHLDSESCLINPFFQLFLKHREL